MRLADRLVGAASALGLAAWSAYILVAGSDAGLTVTTLLVLTYGGLAVLGVWATWLAVHLVAAHRAAARPRWRLLAVQPLVLITLFGATWLGGTFRLRFAASKAALDRLAQHGGDAAGEPVPPGTRVGLFRVKEAEFLQGGAVRLITTDCMFDHCGVAYSPSGPPPRIGEDAYSPLVQNWWHWSRSW
jgi:hypothetical protein